MTTERDPRTRIVLSWLREDAHENAERVLLRALDEADATPQRRSSWPAWRTNGMNTYAKLIAAAAVVLVVAIVGYQFLPGGSASSGTSATSSPSPALLARGTFESYGGAVELEATGEGSGVTGIMTVSVSEGDPWVVDLQCARTTPDGLIAIGGDATESTYDYAPEGTRVAIILQRGSPVEAVFWFEHPDPAQASCPAFLESVADDVADHLEPIEGTVQLGP